EACCEWVAALWFATQRDPALRSSASAPSGGTATSSVWTDGAAATADPPLQVQQLLAPYRRHTVATDPGEPMPTYWVQGKVFNDANANGVKDGGEGGLANATWQVEQPAGTVINSGNVAADGTYLADLSAFGAGTFVVRAGPPPAGGPWTATTTN